MEKNLYCGKRMKDGQLVEGYYVFQDVEAGDKEIHHFILTHDKFGFSWHKVDPATVGQYTGLKDKNGRHIFERDIVKYRNTTAVVVFEFGCFCFRATQPDYLGRDIMAANVIFGEYSNEIEIIGNIHDNPELLDTAEA